ncbi:MAG: O-antigen ligase family protein, partial [Methylococcales bacterium]
MYDNTAIPGKENPVVQAGAVFCALLMFTVPFSTSISIAMTFLVFACWLLSSQYRSLTLLTRTNPVVASALLLCALFLIGTLYADAGAIESLSMLQKYRELLLIAILVPFMRNEKHRRWVMYAFIGACILTLLGSYLKDFGLLPLSRQGTATFKSRITHNIIMALFAYFCVHQAKTNRRWLWLTLGLLAAYNLLVVVQGRTGQVIFILLMILFCFQSFSTRRALILTPLLVIFFIGVLNSSGSGERFKEGIQNSTDYLHGRQDLESSMGQRLYFWQNSINLIIESPLIGYGTGSFNSQFNRITGSKFLLTENPHNEYLMISVQLGAIGLFAYLFFLACQWRCSFDLPDDRRWFAQGVVVS